MLFVVGFGGQYCTGVWFYVLMASNQDHTGSHTLLQETTSDVLLYLQSDRINTETR
jgi:hypothetical protein